MIDPERGIWSRSRGSDGSDILLRVKGRTLLAVAIASTLVASACKKPDPPHVVPKEARVVGLGPRGLDVQLKVEATNPNGVTLSVQSFTGKAKLDGRWDMGSVTVSKPVVLPPRTPTMIDVPMTLPWTDMTALAQLATSPRPVPYVVEGTAKIGGEKLNVDVPFSIPGTITREQIVAAALGSLPAFSQ